MPKSKVEVSLLGPRPDVIAQILGPPAASTTPTPTITSSTDGQQSRAFSVQALIPRRKGVARHAIAKVLPLGPKRTGPCFLRPALLFPAMKGVLALLHI